MDDADTNNLFDIHQHHQQQQHQRVPKWPAFASASKQAEQYNLQSHPSSLLQSFRMSQQQSVPAQPAQAEKVDYRRAMHNTAILGAIVFPILIALPPRKFDAYTAGLAFGTYYCSNHLVQERTGRTITENLFGARHAQPIMQELPPMDMSSAQMEELRIRRQEELRLARQELHGKGKEWAVERQKEIEDAVGEGKGFADMIMDQISEVVNWGKKKDDD